MTKFKYSEKVILKSTGKEVSIVSATHNGGNGKSNYILSNGNQAADIDLLKLSEKKQIDSLKVPKLDISNLEKEGTSINTKSKAKKKVVSVLRDLDKVSENQDVKK